MGSVSEWIGELKQGREEAAKLLWERFYFRLVAVSRAKLKEFPRRARDEEDLALSAFEQFCRSARDGKFPRLEDRSSLWRLLVDIADKKVISYKRWETSGKRGGGRRVIQNLTKNLDGDSHDEIDDLVDRAFTPDYIVVFNDTLRHLLNMLPEENQRSVAIHKITGLSNAQVAQEMNISLRTVERKLSVIQKLWNRELVK